MFDIYVYDADNGECVGVDPAYSEKAVKAAAMTWHNKGHLIKVVDTFDGVVVSTLG
jgi:hypothetical protein